MSETQVATILRLLSQETDSERTTDHAVAVTELLVKRGGKNGEHAIALLTVLSVLLSDLVKEFPASERKQVRRAAATAVRDMLEQMI